MRSTSRAKSLRDQCNKCRHFTGIGNDAKGERLTDRRIEDIDGKPDGRGACAAGVLYNTVMARGSRMIALPCFPVEKDNMPADGKWPTCDKCAFKTDTELDAEVAGIEARSRVFIERLTIVRPAILKHAGWDEKKIKRTEDGEPIVSNRRKGAQGQFPCPVCKIGTLRYSISGFNGHIHAHCTTDNCVSWME